MLTLILNGMNLLSVKTEWQPFVTGVVLGVYKFRASGEGIGLQKIALKLTNGKASDLAQVYVYDRSGTLRGTGFFTGGNTVMLARSILCNPVIFFRCVPFLAACWFAQDTPKQAVIWQPWQVARPLR